MNKQQFSAILKAVPKLDPYQKKRLNLTLNSQENVILNNLTQECIKHHRCVHCDDACIVKWGKANGRQRFKCKACNKTFVCTWGSAYFYQHRSDDWQLYLEKMLNRDSLRRCAKDIGICLSTAFFWRHRYMKKPGQSFVLSHEQGLEGIVEADETYFRKSRKGERGLGKSSRKRGTKASTKGLNKNDWVAVLTAMDRGHHEFDHILKTVNSNEIERHLKGLLAADSVLCTDGQPAYNQLCKNGGIHHVVLKDKRTVNGVFHIQNINSYHSQLKLWYRQMHGVASKYLSRYLGWFRMLKWQQYEKVENLFDIKLLALQQHDFKT